MSESAASPSARNGRRASDDGRSRGRFGVEVASWAAIAVVAWSISARYDVFDKIVAFSRANDEWHIDDALSLVIIAAVTAFFASLAQSRQQSSRRRKAEREAYLAARRDDLTNLPNRRMFTELAGRALGVAWRRHTTCAVFFIDLDGFKPVNDTHGHATGDALLVAVADLLRRELPAAALPARIGGDEFAVLLPNVADAAHAQAQAERLRAAVTAPFRLPAATVAIGATIGIAVGPEHGRRAEDLIHAADLAMYEAKRDGKGQVRLYRPAVAEPAFEAAGQADRRTETRGRLLQAPLMGKPAGAKAAA